MSRDLDPLDLVLYAPVGAALEIRSRFPELADAGRRHLGMQVLTARSIGQFAVTQARRQLPSVLDELRARGLDPLGLLPTSGSSSATADEDDEAPLAPVVDLPTARAEQGQALAADELPIPDYDSLSAVQVVPRLDALDDDALASIERYESSNRGRRTILHRVAQLRGEVS
ncbi:MAG: hypothetical protein AAGD18_04900 [Actinomycetota bacterium]